MATFTQQGNTTNAARYTAEIDWGDGTPDSGGTIVANGQGGFVVYGNHSYANDVNTYTIAVTINDTQTGSTAAATATSTAQITNQLYWDASNTSDWASGVWHLGAADGPAVVGWDPNCDAVFPAGTGTVLVSGNVSVGTIEFQASGTEIESETAADTLTLAGGQVTVDSANTDTLAANITGGSLTKLGPGALVVEGENAYDGPPRQSATACWTCNRPPPCPATMSRGRSPWPPAPRWR